MDTTHTERYHATLLMCSSSTRRCINQLTDIGVFLLSGWIVIPMLVSVVAQSKGYTTQVAILSHLEMSILHTHYCGIVKADSKSAGEEYV
uniref:Uncharacterized protein n=1 Tax=Peronospora matthiolae TaxID=2874970 RepID=A0AAV1V5V3_9STRA